jgi:tetratricopeptide (TPR) repeat protein
MRLMRLSLLVGLLLAGPAWALETEPDGTLFEDPELGFRVAMPPHRTVKRVGGNAVVGLLDDGSILRVYPVFVARSATADACWRRLLEAEVLPREMLRQAQSPDALARLGAAGIDGRAVRAFLSVHPRPGMCLVMELMVPRTAGTDGAGESLAKSLRESLVLLEPSPEAAVALEVEAGFQLLDAEEHAEALSRFESALRRAPETLRARMGAGLSAFFAGKGYERRAIEHLARVHSEWRPGIEAEEAEEVVIGERQYREVLMDLGLAHAAVGELVVARERLLEARARFPNDAIVVYNLACVLSLGREGDESVEALVAAFRLDPQLTEHARSDADLAFVRSRPDVARLLRSAANDPARVH